MADSAVAVTAGSGTNIDTRTEATNGNHRQVMVLGDPSTNAGVAPVDATAGLKVDLGADNDVTVTGTVDLGATDNAVLDVIAGDTTSIDGKITACNTGDVTIGSALPAGTNAIGKLSANSGVDIGDVDILSIAAGDNNIGNVDIASALPAGTNAIGKLAANSGVDIGDVDVTSITNGSLNGPGSPTIDSYTHAAISASADTANQSLVAAPGASKQIWVYGIQFTAGTGDGSVSIQDEDDTAITGVMEVSQTSGMAISPSGNFAMPIWKVATNKALEVDTVTCDIKGSIQYAVVSV